MNDYPEIPDLEGSSPDWEQDNLEEAYYYATIDQFLELVEQYGMDRITKDVLSRVK